MQQCQCRCGADFRRSRSPSCDQLCSFLGYMTVAPDRATMLGGLAVNVSGPCFRAADNVVVLFDEFLISCRKLNMHRAMCMLPKFHKVGMINTRISRDGGASFPYIGVFYIGKPFCRLSICAVKMTWVPQFRLTGQFLESFCDATCTTTLAMRSIITSRLS